MVYNHWTWELWHNYLFKDNFDKLPTWQVTAEKLKGKTIWQIRKTKEQPANCELKIVLSLISICCFVLTLVSGSGISKTFTDVLQCQFWPVKGGGGQWGWDLYVHMNFFEQMPPNFVTLSEIYLLTIWHDAIVYCTCCCNVHHNYFDQHIVFCYMSVFIANF